MSCLGRIYRFSLRVRRLASRHSKGVKYWGSGLEAVDPMATTGRGGNPRCPNVFGRTRQGKPEVRAAVRNVFLTSWGPGKAEAGGLLSRLGRLPHKLVTGKGRSRRSFQPLGTSPCKTQNSGLCSKDEKLHDPIDQPSRCNTQEGLLSVAQTGDSDLLGGRAHRTANWASFL